MKSVSIYLYPYGHRNSTNFEYMGRINQERKNDPLGSLYSELWQLGTIWRKNSNVMKISAIVQNCRAIFASQSNIKNKFRNIFKNIFENFQKKNSKNQNFQKKNSKFKNFQIFFWKCSQNYFLNCFDSRESRGNSLQLLKFS